jgi:hypothetical protein
VADAKITALTELAVPDSTDLLVIVDDVAGTPVTKKITLGNLTTSLTTTTLVVDTTTLVVDSTNNRVGIGTATPTQGDLHVVRAVSNPSSVYGMIRTQFTAIGTATVSDRYVGLYSEASDHASVVNKTITGAVTNGGLIRITATGHGFATSDKIAVYGVVGTTEANGAWTITVIDANTFDLQGSTFTNAYVSGGTATNRPMMSGVAVAVAPRLSRGSLTGTAAAGDDANGVTVSNVSGVAGAKATDAYYIARNPAFSSSEWEWSTGFTSDANLVVGLQLGGNIGSYGINLSGATFATGAYAVNLGSNKFDIRSASAGIQILFADATADATQKVGRMGVPHYTNSEEPVAVAVVVNSSGGNEVRLGGGTGVFNAATAITFYTGATPTTTTGTVRMTLDTSGDLTFADGLDIILNATTGTKIGTATTQKLGFWNATPVVRPSAYTPTNVVTDRAYDANATTTDELADVLGTLIADLQSIGLIG